MIEQFGDNSFVSHAMISAVFRKKMVRSVLLLLLSSAYLDLMTQVEVGTKKTTVHKVDFRADALSDTTSDLHCLQTIARHVSLLFLAEC